MTAASTHQDARPGRRRWLSAALLLAAVSVLSAAGCRESRTEQPPIHLNLNMDHQAYLEAQEAVNISVDGHQVFDYPRAMRGYVEGTVAAGADDLRVDTVYYGGTVNGSYVTSLPQQLELDEALVERGQARFEIYCTPCHDATGSGNGLVVQRGFTPPPSYHDDMRRSYPIGRLYEIISQGGETMPAFASQIPVRDRWAIAVYVRSLQFSHNVELEALPGEVREEIKAEVSGRRAGQQAGAALRQQVQGAADRVTVGGGNRPSQQQPGGANP